MELIPGLTVPDDLITIRASRGGGPGGQNVNKVSSRVEVLLDTARFVDFPADALERLLKAHRKYFSNDGVLRIVCQIHRDQTRNREEALARLGEMLAAALVRPIIRRPTRPTKGSQRRRVESKQRRSTVKRQRGGLQPGDE